MDIILIILAVILIGVAIIIIIKDIPDNESITILCLFLALVSGIIALSLHYHNIKTDLIRVKFKSQGITSLVNSSNLNFKVGDTILVKITNYRESTVCLNKYFIRDFDTVEYGKLVQYRIVVIIK